MVGSSKADEVEDISKEEREALTGSILTDMPIEEVFDDEDYVLELARATLTSEEFNEYLKYELPGEYNGLQLAQAKMRLLAKRHSVLPPTDPKYDLRTRKPIAVDKDNEIVRANKAASIIQRALTHGKRGKDRASRVRRTAGQIMANKTIDDILNSIDYNK